MNVNATTSRPPVVRAGSATVVTIAEAKAPSAIGSQGNGTKGPSPRVMMHAVATAISTMRLVPATHGSVSAAIAAPTTTPRSTSGRKSSATRGPGPAGATSMASTCAPSARESPGPGTNVGVTVHATVRPWPPPGSASTLILRSMNPAEGSVVRSRIAPSTVVTSSGVVPSGRDPLSLSVIVQGVRRSSVGNARPNAPCVHANHIPSSVCSAG